MLTEKKKKSSFKLAYSIARGLWDQVVPLNDLYLIVCNLLNSYSYLLLTVALINQLAQLALLAMQLMAYTKQIRSCISPA